MMYQVENSKTGEVYEMVFYKNYAEHIVELFEEYDKKMGWYEPNCFKITEVDVMEDVGDELEHDAQVLRELESYLGFEED